MEKETGFWPAIKDFFFRAGDFKGVSSRSQYWWVFLGQFLLGLVVGALFGIAVMFRMTDSHSFGASLFVSLTSLAASAIAYTTYPSLSLIIRRYRDAKVSPWWYLVLVVISLLAVPFVFGGNSLMLALPIIAAIADLVILLLPSREQTIKPFSVQPGTKGSLGVGFGSAIKDFFLRGGDFTGTSSRSQYWWIVLLLVLISIPTLLFIVFSLTAVIIGGVASSGAMNGTTGRSTLQMFSSLGSGVLVLAIILFVVIYGWALMTLPILTVAWRRFKDAGVSPWWLAAFIVVTGVISSLSSSDKSPILTLLTILVAIIQIIIVALPTKQIDNE